uniref:NADH-ubiquinone oxidoreductase chain 2 n=1 Tax=Pariaconus pele TaxID=1950172 RepID=A0A344A2M1_9HEMI|nr:NADH dehydrogenase subunit 2 [Pariaconus pele]AWU49012.1 NADH dehydrogenase subunit 2 [Pariaconus pele]
MNPMNLIHFSLYIMTIIFSLSSNSWVMIWMSMEMNLLMFIFLMMETPISMIKTESTLKYFLIQSISSVMFITSINSNLIFYNEKLIINMMLPPIALMIKSGMAPVHSWSPPIVSKFSLMSLTLFMTVQKLIPMFLIFSSWIWIFPLSVIFNVAVGSAGGLIQSSVIKMMIFSSINNTGWMLLTMMDSFLLFWIYFMNYMLFTLMMMKFLWKSQIKWISQIKSSSPSVKWMYFSIMMSMSGLPPFMGFTPKWLTIKYLFFNNMLVILICACLSIITLFFYLKSSISLITMMFTTKKWMLNFVYSINITFMINLIGPIAYYLVI